MTEGRRPYRPVATWFLLGLAAVSALLLLAKWLQERYG